MFDLAISEAGHPEESIKSLDNSSDKLTQAVYDNVAVNRPYDPEVLAIKFNMINEMEH